MKCFICNKGRGCEKERGETSDVSPVRGPALLFCKSSIIVNPPLVIKELLRVDSDVKLHKEINWQVCLQVGENYCTPANSCRESFKMLLMGCFSSLLDARCLRQHRLLLVKHI